MRSSVHKAAFLGIEGGGTHTTAVFEVDGVRHATSFGPGNVRLLSDDGLRKLFKAIHKRGGVRKYSGIGIGMAGARDEADKQRITRAAAAIWKNTPCVVCSDLEIALASVPKPAGCNAQVLMVSGTGSCCLAMGRRTKKIGGWGHILGDRGSGYDIALRALRGVLETFDVTGKWPELGARFLRHLLLNQPTDLISWAQTAEKPEMASLAEVVFRSAESDDQLAISILTDAAKMLAADAVDAALAVTGSGKKNAVQFVFHGSIFARQPRFARRVSKLVRIKFPGRSQFFTLETSAAHGALELARAGQTKSSSPRFPSSPSPASLLSETELRNPGSMNLDRLSISESVALMLAEERRVSGALLAKMPEIQRAVEIISKRLKAGGRLFYLGAGTSGRLGVLDAVECIPTFQTDPEQIQGIIAGGQSALWRAAEGAEDDANAGGEAIRFRGVGRKDAVVGIAASGRTPFVRGALREAKKRRAATILIAFNKLVANEPRAEIDLMIVPEVGPEVLTGSTRLKCGTATKIVLNILSTLSMVQMGKVIGNLMVDVKATNEKLRARAVRIVRELSGCTESQARTALVSARWDIRRACADLV